MELGERSVIHSFWFYYWRCVPRDHCHVAMVILSDCPSDFTIIQEVGFVPTEAWRSTGVWWEHHDRLQWDNAVCRRGYI